VTNFASPTKECDLVMKGGITSGIVYPPAVIELATKFRFRNIGGTSAGAIAAAVTAAAEYGRESQAPKSGFAGLGKMQEWLSEGTHLFDLFQPNKTTRALYCSLLGLAKTLGKAEEKRKVRAQRSKKEIAKPGPLQIGLVVLPSVLLRVMPDLFFVGAVLGFLAIGGLAFGEFTYLRQEWLVWTLTLVIAAIGAWVGGALACAIQLVNIARSELPKNFFGICKGMPPDDPPKTEALTDWLHNKVQELAGLGHDTDTLTVGDLAAKRDAHGHDVGITLQMITTNLSHSQPHALPFENEFFLFNETEMAELFPKVVVEHLKSRARKPERITLPPCFHALPWGRDLPVVLLARMSLSFPMLLSATPLYSIRPEAYRRDSAKPGEPVAIRAGDLQCVWFSDGGLTSNFPIHFFDSWLPGRPTFGINLTSYPVEAFQGGRDADITTRQKLEPSKLAAVRPAAGSELSGEESEAHGSSDDAVQLPPANRTIRPPYVEILSLGNFFNAIWTTAQNFRDSTLSRLPSYRDRIVQIAFAPDEGGLNLAMGKKQIDNIVGKGKRAGELLRDEFDFDHHRWVRLRVLLAELEPRLDRLADLLDDYDKLSQGVDGEYPYPPNAEWRKDAPPLIETLRAAANEVRARRKAQGVPPGGKPYVFDERSPKPHPVLRITPRV
jgi:hypothetical protein